MRISVLFEELQKVASENLRTGNLSFSQVDSKTVRVTYKMVLPVSVDLKIDSIVGHDVFLSYNGGMAVKMAVGSLAGLIASNKELAFIDLGSDGKIAVHLDMIDKVKPVFERIDLDDILIQNDAVEVCGSLR